MIGAVHGSLIDIISPEATLVAVADSDLAKAQTLADVYGVRATQSLDDLLSDGSIDAISVCTPSGLHADVAVSALHAGKHVLIEKPIDISLAAADRIIEAEQSSGKTVSVISQRRFQPAPVYVRQAIDDGRLGRLSTGSVESTFFRTQDYYDSGGWRGTWELDGGGALMNQGIHGLDLLTWMLGEPVRVTAQAGLLAHERIEVEDTIAATVVFASGAIGTITATTAAYPGRNIRLIVGGTTGVAVVDEDVLQYIHTKDQEPVDFSGIGDGRHIDEQSAQLANHAELAVQAEGAHDVLTAHAAQYRDFVDAARNGRPPRVTTAHGRRNLALILAIYESARQGGNPVLVDAGC